jgi:prophage regulatory protein
MARIIRRPLVSDKTGLQRSAIYEKFAKGEFPKPVKLGTKAVGWLESEVDAWIAERVANRDGKA